MKKISTHLFNHKLVLIVLTVLSSICISTQQADAQTASAFDNTYAVPQGNFVDVATAISRLEIQLASMKQIMATMNHQTPQYLEWDEKYRYLDSIRALLVDGKGTDGTAVAQAISDAMKSIVADDGGVTAKRARVYRQDAINLLKL